MQPCYYYNYHATMYIPTMEYHTEYIKCPGNLDSPSMRLDETRDVAYVRLPYHTVTSHRNGTNNNNREMTQTT